MRKILFITGFTYLFLCIEYVIHNLGFEYLRPNFLLIFIIFINLLFGIRYSLVTAVLAGLLKDSFSATTFGINLLSFVICAFLVTALKQYIYMIGSRTARVILVFVIVTLNVLINFALHQVYYPVEFIEMIRYVFLPEVIATLVVSGATIEWLKKCALKLFVS